MNHVKILTMVCDNLASEVRKKLVTEFIDMLRYVDNYKNEDIIVYIVTEDKNGEIPPIMILDGIKIHLKRITVDELQENTSYTVPFLLADIAGKVVAAECDPNSRSATERCEKLLNKMHNKTKYLDVFREIHKCVKELCFELSNEVEFTKENKIKIAIAHKCGMLFNGIYETGYVTTSYDNAVEELKNDVVKHLMLNIPMLEEVEMSEDKALYEAIQLSDFKKELNGIEASMKKFIDMVAQDEISARTLDE